MASGLKAGNLVLQPGKDFFDDEAVERVVAGIVLLAGRHIKMIEKGESDGRQGMVVEQIMENGKEFHFLQIEFAIEKKAEAVGLIGGAAQQMEGTGITHDRIRDGVGLELEGVPAFCHVQEFNHGYTQMNTDFEP
jgi:hypothetical protein